MKPTLVALVLTALVLPGCVMPLLPSTSPLSAPSPPRPTMANATNAAPTDAAEPTSAPAAAEWPLEGGSGQPVPNATIPQELANVTTHACSSDYKAAGGVRCTDSAQYPRAWHNDTRSVPIARACFETDYIGGKTTRLHADAANGDYNGVPYAYIAWPPPDQYTGFDVSRGKQATLNITRNATLQWGVLTVEKDEDRVDGWTHERTTLFGEEQSNTTFPTWVTYSRMTHMHLDIPDDGTVIHTCPWPLWDNKAEWDAFTNSTMTWQRAYDNATRPHEAAKMPERSPPQPVQTQRSDGGNTSAS